LRRIEKEVDMKVWKVTVKTTNAEVTP